MTVKRAGNQDLGVVHLSSGFLSPDDQGFINQHPSTPHPARRRKARGRLGAGRHGIKSKQ